LFKICSQIKPKNLIPDSLNDELINISQKLENRKQIVQNLKEAKRVQSAEHIKLEATKRRINEEFQEVKDLETFTLKSVWYDLLNKKFSELEREQAEYYQAKIWFESQQNTFDKLSLEIKSYEAQLFDFETIKVNYEGLVQEKVNLLKENNHPRLVEIFTKQDELLKIDSYANEIREALLAVEGVLNILPRVVNDLKVAKSYATWDMVGGGAMSTYLKRQKMNKAKLGIIEINYALDKLRRELRGLTSDMLPAEIKLNTSWEFADYFFDNIFVDMEIKSRIADAHHSIISLFNSVILLKEKLNFKKDKQQNLYQATESDFRKLVELV
jgi:hypothetical protein